MDAETKPVDFANTSQLFPLRVQVHTDTELTDQHMGKVVHHTTALVFYFYKYSKYLWTNMLLKNICALPYITKCKDEIARLNPRM